MKKLLLFIMVLFTVLFVSISPLWAFDSKSGENVSITTSLDDDIYVFGSNVLVSEDVEGDLVTAGGRIEVSGDVSQDLMVAGGTVNLNGDVGDDVRVSGGILTISGDISDDLLAAGGQITVSEKTDIGGSAVITGGTINFEGTSGEGAILNAGNITISGKIKGDVEIGEVESLKITGSAEITGDLIYRSASRANISDDAIIGGEIKETIIEQRKIAATDTNPWAIFIATYIGGRIIAFLALFVLGIILLLAMPGFFERFTERMKKTLGYSIGSGAIVIFGVPIGSVIIFIITIILFITIIGSALGAVLMASNIVMLIVYGILIYTSTVFLSFTLGKVILSKTSLNMSKYGWKVLAYLIGLVIIMILYGIPFLGWLIRFAGVLFGTGAVVLVLKDIIVSKKN
ncbi:MAG: polymer-forming cytoskeletal protein [Actinobacteria bacterium]|nr:polymer-forming cytoskeletal protein [Actinomycetota bacterium]